MEGPPEVTVVKGSFHKRSCPPRFHLALLSGLWVGGSRHESPDLEPETCSDTGGLGQQRLAGEERKHGASGLVASRRQFRAVEALSGDLRERSTRPKGRGNPGAEEAGAWREEEAVFQKGLQWDLG